jgi:diguanylate cyclase (GGDEF)-like protein/PAS domain S-box-containing protein
MKNIVIEPLIHSGRRMRLVWVLLVVFLVFLGGLLSADLYVARQTVLTHERDSLAHQAAIIDVNLSRQLQTTSNGLDAIRQELPELRGPRAPQDLLNHRLRVLVTMQTGVSKLLVLDRDGLVVGSSRQELMGNSFRDAPPYTAISQDLRPGKLFISEPFVTPLGNYAVSVSRVLLDAQGRFDGYVMAILDPEFFGTLLRSVLNEPDMHASIVHRDGKVVFRVPDTEGVTGLDLARNPGALYWQYIRSGLDAGILSGMTATTGQNSLVAFQAIRPVNHAVDKILVATVSRSLPDVLARWHSELLTRLGLWALTAAISVCGLLLYQQRQNAFDQLAVAADADRLEVVELLSLAERAAHAGAWIWNIQTRKQRWSAQMYRLLGLEPGRTTPGLAAWRAVLHPDDRAQAQAIVETALKELKPFVTGYRIVLPTGEVRWVDAYGDISYDESGAPLQFSGLCVDATQRRQMEQQVGDSEGRFRRLFEHLPVAYQSLDVTGCWLDANQKMAELLAFESPEAMVGLDFSTFCEEPSPRQFDSAYEQFKNTHSMDGELLLRRQDGERVTVIITGRIQRDASGDFLRTHCIIIDISERRRMENQVRQLNAELEDKVQARTAELGRLNEELNHLSRTDALTGLPNRMAANERLYNAFISMKRTQKPYAVLMIDVDYFKRVNDTYGHDVGDQVLQRVGQVLQGGIRETDFVARFGGEEFMVLLPDTDALAARQVAEKILRSVESEPDPVAGILTLSIGLAIAQVSDETEVDSLKVADTRLYVAKRTGRNRVVSDTAQVA